jgi:hypothetical protein
MSLEHKGGRGKEVKRGGVGLAFNETVVNEIGLYITKTISMIS